MRTNLVQLADEALKASSDNRQYCLHKLLSAVKRTTPAELAPVENVLPELANYLCDPEAGEITLELFSYCKINLCSINRLVDLQRAQPNPTVVVAFGKSDPGLWNSASVAMLAEALTVENTAVAAAEILYRQSDAFNPSLTICSLEHQAVHSTLHVRGDAISKLISHTEGAHGPLACQSLERLLQTADATIRGEIASKLAWTHNRGLTLLQITATDNHPGVRLAAAKSLSHGYRYRGKRLLAALAKDHDPQVRRYATRALALR